MVPESWMRWTCTSLYSYLLSSAVTQISCDGNIIFFEIKNVTWSMEALVPQHASGSNPESRKAGRLRRHPLGTEGSALGWEPLANQVWPWVHTRETWVSML